MTDGVDHTDYEGTVGSKNTCICELAVTIILLRNVLGYSYMQY